MAARGWKAADLARRAGLDPSTISKVLSGQRMRLSEDTVAKLAGAFGRTVDELRVESLGLPRPPPVEFTPLERELLLIGEEPVAYAGPTDSARALDDAMRERIRSRGRHLEHVRVSGDCMEPEVRAGDIVLVDPTDTYPTDGRLVVVVTDEGDVLLKRFRILDGEPFLTDNKGRVLRPNGARIQGIARMVARELR